MDCIVNNSLIDHMDPDYLIACRPSCRPSAVLETNRLGNEANAHSDYNSKRGRMNWLNVDILIACTDEHFGVVLYTVL